MRGIVISDYQNHIEKIWLKNLKNKYKVNVNEKVLRNIKNSLN